METLKTGTSAEKAIALEKFNQTYDNYNVDNISTPVIECKFFLSYRFYISFYIIS